MPKFEENALYVGGKCSKKLAMLKKILMLFMSENAKNYAGLFYRWLLLDRLLKHLERRHLLAILPLGKFGDIEAASVDTGSWKVIKSPPKSKPRTQ